MRGELNAINARKMGFRNHSFYFHLFHIYSRKKNSKSDHEGKWKT